MDWACESQSAALRSQSRLSMSLVYGWTEGRGTSHWWVEVLGTTQPAVGSPQAEPTTSHWLPWHIRQHPWGKEFGEGREKKKSKQGVRGPSHTCVNNVTLHPIRHPCLPCRCWACFPWHRYPESGIRLKGPNCHLLSMLPGQGLPGL